MHVGHVGTGFNERELGRLMTLLRPLETKACPFRDRPSSNERPHWVAPTLVAQVKFTEWTDDGNLRHPVYQGCATTRRRRCETRRDAQTASDVNARRPAQPRRRRPGRSRNRAPHRSAIGHRLVVTPDPGRNSMRRPTNPAVTATGRPGGKDGTVDLPGGGRVTSLHKVSRAEDHQANAALLRHCGAVGPAGCRPPLVMKRFPNGSPEAIYQHRAPPCRRHSHSDRL